MKDKKLIYSIIEEDVIKDALWHWADELSVNSEPQDKKVIKICNKLLKKMEQNNEK